MTRRKTEERVWRERDVEVAPVLATHGQITLITTMTSMFGLTRHWRRQLEGT
jgi:hypothetical protein